MTGIPITNVNNNCSTGSTALFNANNAVKSSLVDCALALGFERMAPGSLGTHFPDRTSPTILFGAKSQELESDLKTGKNSGPGAPRIFGNAGQEYCDKYGADITHLARIGVCSACTVVFRTIAMAFRLLKDNDMLAAKNHKHSVNNPYSQFRNGWTEEQVLNAPKINNQLTKFMCSPTSASFTIDFPAFR